MFYLAYYRNMQVPSWIISIITVFLSGILSLLVSRHIVNKRIDEDRQRDVEQWYVSAGVQADLAENDWTTEILSEAVTENKTEEVLRSRAEKLTEHAAEGKMLGADEEVISSLQQLSSKFRWAATLLERDRPDKWSDIKDIEDEMWGLVKIIQKRASESTDYSI